MDFDLLQQDRDHDTLPVEEFCAKYGHCTRGGDEVCGLDEQHDDHGRRCCHCDAVIPPKVSASN